MLLDTQSGYKVSECPSGCGLAFLLYSASGGFAPWQFQRPEAACGKWRQPDWIQGEVVDRLPGWASGGSKSASLGNGKPAALPPRGFLLPSSRCPHEVHACTEVCADVWALVSSTLTICEQHVPAGASSRRRVGHQWFWRAEPGGPSPGLPRSMEPAFLQPLESLAGPHSSLGLNLLLVSKLRQTASSSRDFPSKWGSQMEGGPVWTFSQIRMMHHRGKEKVAANARSPLISL